MKIPRVSSQNRFYFLALIFLTSIPSALSAETPATPKPRFGFEFGGNLAIRRDDSGLSTDPTLTSRLGYAGGVFLQINFDPTLAFQTEILYSQKGYIHDYGGGNTETIEFGYVEFPQLFKLYLSTSAIKPNFFAGSSLGFVLTAQDVTSFAGTYKIDSSLLWGAEVSLIGGFGVDIDNFSISGRYQMGLSNFNRVSYYGAPGFQNSIFNVMAGYSFF